MSLLLLELFVVVVEEETNDIDQEEGIPDTFHLLVDNVLYTDVLEWS